MNKENKNNDINLDNKYIIDTTDLKKGDIIFSTSFTLISKTIRYFTTSDYSHVMLYTDDNSIIHADGNGVHAYNTQRLTFDDESHSIVYRLKDEVSDTDINKVVNYMRRLIGRPYSTFEAMLTKFYKGDFKSKKLFCSRLVAQAYAEIDKNLTKSTDYCSPEEMRTSPILEKVMIPLRKLKNYEKEIILTTNDKPAIQAEITNILFTNIINLTSNKSLYDFETLSYFLVKNQNYDKEISNIIRDSGYLTIWVDELKDNAPLYDNELYSKLISYEQKILFSTSSLDGLTRYENMHNIHLKLYSQYQLKTFKDLLILYSILVNNESLRLSALNIIELEEHSTFILFIQTLVKIFFIVQSLKSILKDKTYEKEYYNLIMTTIKFIIDNLKVINIHIVEFKLENDFNSINKNI